MSHSAALQSELIDDTTDDSNGRYSADVGDDYHDEEDEDVTDDEPSSCASSAEYRDKDTSSVDGCHRFRDEVTSLADSLDVVPYQAAFSNNNSKRLGLASDSGDIHEILSYPADPRSVRIPDYDLKPMGRCSKLPSLFFGPKNVATVVDMLKRWRSHTILPSAIPNGPTGGIETPFVSEDLLSASRTRLLQHRARNCKDSDRQIMVFRSKQAAQPFIPRATGRLEVLLGYELNTTRVSFRSYDSKLVSCSGLPIAKGQTDETKPEGLMLDVGGVVQDIAWAPRMAKVDQFLLLSVTPLREEAIWEGKGVDRDLATGCLQLWTIPASSKEEKCPRLPCKPLLSLVIFADWGRFKKIQWCPVPVDSVKCLGRVATLSGDGVVRVFEIPGQDSDGKTEYAQITKPLATLALEHEKNIWCTCMTWVNYNRICVGHVDGTLTLWSIQPTILLQRHLVYNTQLLDIHSAYPSNPTLIASIPLSGCVALTDLTRPTSETTSVPINSMNFSPHLLDWSDILQSFISPSPAMGGVNTCIAILNRRYFPTVRNLISLPAIPTCLSTGTVHPFTLLGDTGGSIWACSALARLIFNKTEGAYKMRLLSHEHRPPAVSKVDQGNGKARSSAERDAEKTGENRGFVRIVTGFLPESNINPKTEILAEISDMQTQGKKKRRRRKDKSRAKSKDKKDEAEAPLNSAVSRKVSNKEKSPRKVEVPRVEAGPADTIAMDVDVDDSGGTDVLNNKPPAQHSATDFGDRDGDCNEGVIHEPLSRITVVRWNPNRLFGHWAAAAMASGLVRIMDLGVEF